MRPALALALVLLASSSGCSERRFAGPPPPDSAPPLAASSSEPADLVLDGGAPGNAISWVEAVRLERWADAAAGIDALPEAARARPEMRYVRARAALGVGDGARALALLEGLEPALPELANDVVRYRAEAQLLVGPYAPAAAYFARSHAARDLVRAATAYQKAGDLATARITIDRAVVAASHGRSPRDEILARRTRADLARAAGGDAGIVVAELDLRWIAAHAQGTADGRAAIEALDAIKRPLSPRERMLAMDAIGAPTPTKPGTNAAPKPERPLPRGEVLHARGMALFRARDYEAAASVFRDAASAASGHEAEDLHYAARALSRADHDAEAVKAYRAMIARFPRSPFAEKSAYYAARLELLDGHFKQAAKAYSRYLATYKKGEHRDEAEYERALAWLSSGAPVEARKSLAALAHKAPDDRAARLRQLVGLAADRSGDHAAAVALWTDLAKNQPLTWASIMARARLAAAGAPLPPHMAPEPAGAPAKLPVRLPATAALLASLGLDGDAEAYLVASEREVGAPYGGRESEALCETYGLLSRAKRRYRLGINVVEGSWLLRTPSPAERWAWECVYPRPFASGVRALEVENGLPRGLVHAVMRQESGFDPAIVSPASAVGLMQLIPSTAKQAAAELAMPFDEADLTRPDVNLRLGAFYIAKLLKMFGGNVALAAAAYNAGPKAVSHWVEVSSDDLDLFVARIPFEETRNYVARVVQNLARYQWLEGGEEAVTEIGLALPAGARAPADAY